MSGAFALFTTVPPPGGGGGGGLGLPYKNDGGDRRTFELKFVVWY